MIKVKDFIEQNAEGLNNYYIHLEAEKADKFDPVSNVVWEGYLGNIPDKYMDCEVISTGQSLADREKGIAGFYLEIKERELEHIKTSGNRLFVDLDGTCAVWQAVAEEQLFEKGYYRNLAEYENVVAAVNHIVSNNPEVEVFVLSKYLTNSKYALQEKDEWVSEHLPGIDKEHRIFVPYEMDKRDMIPEQLKETDYLLDDYTKNFENWQPPAHGIKLLNGINHTKATWQDNRISLLREPRDLADAIIRVIENNEQIMDVPPQEAATMDYEEAINEALAAQTPDFNMEL